MILKSRSQLRKPIVNIGGYEIIPSLRQVRKGEFEIKNKVYTTFGSLFTGSDAELFLNDDEYKKAASKQKSISQKLARSIYSNGRRESDLEGFLFLYPVLSNLTTTDVDYAIGVVFPDTNTVDAIEYTINREVVKELRKIYGDEHDDDVEETDE